MKTKHLIIFIFILLSLSLSGCTNLIFPSAPTNTQVPEVISPSNTPAPTPAAISTPIPPLRQWATAARASSQYSDPDWAAAQAIGAPNTEGCDDYPTAWASQNSYGVDWLEVAYSTPVIPSEINIYESLTPDFVTLVEVLDVQGNYWPVYSSTGSELEECPYVLNIPVVNITEYVYAVRVTVDQTNASYWNEIDAIELVGIPDATGQVTIPPTPTAVPFVAGECEGGAFPIDLNTSYEFSVQTGDYPDNCEFYCLWVPENGDQLQISISNFDVDLDLYVDTNISLMAFEDFGEWISNEFGDGDEFVQISNPGGRYYIQVCSPNVLASPFTLYTIFTP